MGNGLGSKKQINMIGNQLKYESIPLNLLIRDYRPLCFTSGKYTYSDSYIHPTDNRNHGVYKIFIETGELDNQGQLNKEFNALHLHAEDIKIFMKYISGTCLFNVVNSYNQHRMRFLMAGDCPDGWTSNYDEINERLDTNKIKIKISSESPRPYAQLPYSPLMELQTILSKYAALDNNIKYLMRLNYEADAASDTIRCLVYGKVLEILDALHPLHGKSDKRIEEYYKGMEDVYGKVTIKDLMGLANYRADTRHYVARKGDVKSHPFLTFEELGVYGPLIDNLAINEVRRQFGLEMVLLKGG